MFTILVDGICNLECFMYCFVAFLVSQGEVLEINETRKRVGPIGPD